MQRSAERAASVAAANPDRSGAWTGQPGTKATRAERAQQGRHVNAEAELGEGVQDVVGEGVAAQEREGIVGLAEPLVDDFEACFDGVTPEEAEALADSFRFERCVQRDRLAAVLQATRP
jgi:hypothetical protein